MIPVSDVYLCGWRVWSELPVPELLPWAGGEREPDVRVLLGKAPEIASPLITRRVLQVGLDGTCRLKIPGVAAFHVRDGRVVIIDMDSDADLPMVRNFLFGTVLGILCHQRRLFPLHGACLRLGDGAVALSGRSGAGKSTLAAALVMRGHVLLSDDVCAIDVGGEQPVVWPAFPRVKLWPPSLSAVGLTASLSSADVADREKLQFRFAPVEGFMPNRVPLRAIYFLRAVEDAEDEGIHELHGAQRLEALKTEIFRHRIGREMGRASELFLAASHIAATTPVRVLARRLDLTRLAETVCMLENLHGEGPLACGTFPMTRSTDGPVIQGLDSDDRIMAGERGSSG